MKKDGYIISGEGRGAGKTLRSFSLRAASGIFQGTIFIVFPITDDRTQASGFAVIAQVPLPGRRQ